MENMKKTLYKLCRFNFQWIQTFVPVSCLTVAPTSSTITVVFVVFIMAGELTVCNVVLPPFAQRLQ